MLWPLCGTQRFWPDQTHLPTMASVSLTHLFKTQKCKRSPAWPHTERGGGQGCYHLFHFGDFSHSAWVFLLSPSTCTHVFADLQNLNEIYIRKSPCHYQTPNRSTEQKSMLFDRIHTLYIKVSKLVGWLLTFLKVNCNSWVVVNTINAFLFSSESLPLWTWKWARVQNINLFSVNCTTVK